MYAIVETGGKQYRVQPGQTVEVEKLLAAVAEWLAVGEKRATEDDGS